MRQQRKHAEAEPLMRECLAIRQHTDPDMWTTFETQALLGESLRARSTPALPRRRVIGELVDRQRPGPKPPKPRPGRTPSPE
jgi:hypothetical protein